MWFLEHLPEWIVAIGVVYGGVQSWRNGRQIEASHAKISATQATLATVQQQTNGMSHRLEELARSEGHAEGVAETVAKVQS